MTCGWSFTAKKSEEPSTLPALRLTEDGGIAKVRKVAINSSDEVFSIQPFDAPAVELDVVLVVVIALGQKVLVHDGWAGTRSGPEGAHMHLALTRRVSR